MRKTLACLFVGLGLFLGGTTSTIAKPKKEAPAEAADKKKDEGESKKKDKKEETPFEDLVEDFEKVEGLFSFYHDDEAGKTYLPDDQIPDTLMPILEHARSNYQPFARASIQAALRGEKTFNLDLGHGEFTARSMKRLDKARMHVRDEIRGLALEDSALEDSGVLALYENSQL